MSQTPRTITFTVETQALPARLDSILTAHLQNQEPHFSRARVQKLIDDGAVTVDGKPGKAGQKLVGQETICINIPADVPLDAVAPQEIPLDVVYEDPHLVVINKPVGMVTHPGAGVTEGTLVNALLHHCGQSLSGIGGVLRPGIVHRLDKDTSGLLVIAKDDLTHQGLAAQIKSKQAVRAYYALVEGIVPNDSAVIDKPIGRHPTDRQRMAIIDSGRQAQTRYDVLQRFDKFTLIKATLATGRTHQIRVHMSSLGYPVVGDLKYNRKSTGSAAARAKLGLAGQALHAAFLTFTHPATGKLLELEAPLPADFKKLLDKLSGQLQGNE